MCCKKSKMTFLMISRYTLCLWIVIFTGIRCLRTACSAENKNFPFFPSLITPAPEIENVNIGDFKASVSCKACHIVIFKEWEESSHSKSFEDPIFFAMCQLGSKETKGKIDRLCLGCHSPIGLLTRDIADFTSASGAKMVSKSGVQCDFCHTVAGTNYERSQINLPHNASFVLKPGNVKFGPLQDCNTSFHDSRFSELHTSSTFCGCCHNMYLPDSDLDIIRTFNEWASSIYAQKNITCQDCHMMPTGIAAEVADRFNKPKNPGRAAIVGGKMRESVHVHRFVGGSLIMEKGTRSNVQDKEIKRRLKGATQLKLKMLKNESKKGIYTLEVTVINERAGHNIPTGMAGLRQLWLEVMITDTDGNEIIHYGSHNDDGVLGEGARFIGRTGLDHTGAITYLPWRIVDFAQDTSIPPKGRGKFEYSLALDNVSAWPVKVKVALNYQSIPPKLLNDLLPGSPLVTPIINIASEEISISSP